MTRCKFSCTENKVSDPDNSTFQLSFEAVTCGSEENERFFKYTPCGKMHFAVVNSKTAEMFEVGKEYFIDITPAE